MPNSEIENILNIVSRTKDLDCNSYLFCRSNLIRERKEYKAYAKLAKKQHIDNYIDCVTNYIDQSKNYRELLIMSQNFEMLEYARGGIIDKEQKELLAYNLKLLFQAMDKSKLLDLLINRHNMLCNEEGLEILKTTREQVCDEFDYEKNSRSKISLLYLKNAFWLNKYRRIIKNIHFQEEFDKNLGDIITGENLNYLLYMYSYKTDILKQIFKEDICSEEDIAIATCKEYQDIYKNLFDSVFPNLENDIYEDYNNIYEFARLKGIISIKRNVLTELLLKYQIKESITNSLNPEIKQWGIYKEGDMYTLGVEPDGYMLPATFYIPKTEYLDVLSSLHIEKYSFPEYVPIQRISKKDKAFQSNILIKPTPEQAKQIKLESKRNIQQKDVLKRISEQINGKAHSFYAPNMIDFEIGE